MKSLKLISALIVLIASNCIAQSKNLKTEIVKVYGNCEMCESTIEKAGNLKNIATVDWNKDSKMAIIKYDSLKTSKQEILKNIALAGYDSDSFLAPDDTYANLPACCQYARAKKEALLDEKPMRDMSENHSGHDKMMSMKKEEQNKKQDLKMVFDNYFKVKDALVQSDKNTAAANAMEFLNTLENVKMNELEMDVHMLWMKVLPTIIKNVELISTSKDLDVQRNAFISLSESMYQLAKTIQVETPIYYQHCPMANDGKGANWLSKEKEVKNPYYGSMMLSCGKTVETIK